MTERPKFRYKLTIEYDGTSYVGWQVQKNGLAIQEVLRRAIKAFCGEDVIPFGAGRTDAGVHATGQIAHIDLSRDYPAYIVRNALNQHLKPAPVAIVDAQPVNPEFDARFTANMRHYKYIIINRRAPLTLQKKRAWLIHVPLDADAMQEAAAPLLGKHDFTTFRSIHCQARSPIKTLSRLDVERRGETIYIYACARSFMHNQVRSLVGSLKMVGEGKWPVDHLGKILARRERKACGMVAPAHGLYFTRVDYEQNYERQQAGEK